MDVVYLQFSEVINDHVNYLMYLVLKLKKICNQKQKIEFRDFKEQEKCEENIYYVVDLL